MIADLFTITWIMLLAASILFLVPVGVIKLIDLYDASRRSTLKVERHSDGKLKRIVYKKKGQYAS